MCAGGFTAIHQCVLLKENTDKGTFGHGETGITGFRHTQSPRQLCGQNAPATNQAKKRQKQAKSLEQKRVVTSNYLHQTENPRNRTELE